MNNEHQTMEEEEGNLPYSSYFPNHGPDQPFSTAHGDRFDQYSYASPSWTPATSAPSLSYYSVPLGYVSSTFNVSSSDPTAIPASQYELPSTSFNAVMWPSNPSSGSGGMEGSMGYFTSPPGTGTLNSFAGSTSASPMGPGQEWAATMTPMDTTYGMGSSGSHSMVESHAPGLDAGDFFAGESFDTVPHMSVVQGNNQHTLPGSEIRGTGKAVVQPRTDERFKADTSGRRKSSAGSKETSSTTRKKDKKRKPSSGQDGQPPPVQGPKLRTAARRHASETGNLPKPGESPEDQRARTSHNKVEKEYRNRLNREFELVIDVLPADQALRGQSSRGKMSKADVIGNATATIQSLADEVLQLREKKRQKEEEEKKKKKKKLLNNHQPA